MSKRSLAMAAVVAGVLPLAAYATTQSQYKEAYNDAMEVHQKVVAHKMQWTITNDKLAASRQAAKKGRYDKAVNLAHDAEELAQLAIEQWQHNQTGAWKQTVPQ